MSAEGMRTKSIKGADNAPLGAKVLLIEVALFVSVHLEEVEFVVYVYSGISRRLIAAQRVKDNRCSLGETKKKREQNQWLLHNSHQIN